MEWLRGGSGVRKVIVKMLGSSYLHVNALELIELVCANHGSKGEDAIHATSSN